MKELESVEYDSWKSEHAWMEERYIDEINRQYDDTQSNGSLVVSDADYIALSYSVGATDGRLDVIPFGTEGIYGQPYRSAYLMVHAADRAAAEEYLRAQFGDALVTRDTLLRQNAGDLSESFVTAGISLTVILAFMCLCVFFIMRSSFMSRVREACHRRFPEESAVPIPDRDGYADAVDCVYRLPCGVVADDVPLRCGILQSAAVLPAVAGGWTAGCHPDGVHPVRTAACYAAPAPHAQ